MTNDPPKTCRDILHSLDWSRTRLGPIESWPQSLRGFVSMVLEMPTPAIIFWGTDQTQIYNDGYAVIMGPRHPRYFGAPYRECWPDTYPIIFPWMQRVLAGETIRVEKSLFELTRHGFVEEAYFTFTFSPLRDDSGAIAGILQPVVEVTDAVLAERRLETLRLVAARAGEGDAPKAAFEALADNDKDLPFAVFYAWDERAGRLQPAAACRAERIAGPLLARAASTLDEVRSSGRMARIDDVERLVGFAPPSAWSAPTREAVALPLRRAGAPTGVLVFGVSPNLRFDEPYAAFLEEAARQIAWNLDAEQAKRVERELIARERAALAEADAQRARLQAIFVQAPVAITILRGPRFVVELANPLVLRIWGRTLDHLLGRPLFEAMPDIAGQGLEQLLDGVLRSGAPYVGTERPVQIARLEGGGREEAFFNFVYEPMRDAAGHVEGVMVVATDVTVLVRARRDAERLAAELLASEQREKIAREAAESANRAKDEFLAMLGHELRNPLAPILTALELIRLRDQGNALARERAVIERQARHMVRLVDDLLDVSRITRGKIELKREAVEIAEIIAKAIETTSPALEKLRHELTTRVPPRGLVVHGDPARLVQVFANLLTNAAKYTEEGGRIEVAAERRGDEIVATVRDNGRGISPEMLPRIFGLFTQERQNLDRSEGGLGLGLAIVKSLVEMHGGAVDAASEGFGRGSVFTVRLPAARTSARPEAPSPAAPPSPETAAAGNRGSVLIVDDNEDAAAMLADVLHTLGYATVVAHDGPEAIAVARRRAFDLVLLDLGLPGMDGYEVAEQLRTIPGWRAARFVALTGYGQESDRRRSQKADFEAHLVKPVDVRALEELLAALR